jgi:hypothetical protein
MAEDDVVPKAPPKKGGPPDIQDAWRVLAGGAPVAAAALVDIAEHGKSEVARVQASTAILDRVGLAPPKEIHFRVVPSDAEEHGLTQQLSPAEVIRKRLADLKGPTAALVSGQGQDAAMAEALGLDDWQGQDTEIVDAELMPLDEAHDGDWGNPWS